MDDQASPGPNTGLDPATVRSLSSLIAAAMTDDDAYRQLPVPVRASMAAMVLAATGRRLNKKVLAEVGGYRRGTAHREGGWTVDIDALIESAHNRVNELLGRAPAQEDAATLRAKLDVAHRNLGESRQEVDALKTELAQLTSYTLGVARRLRDFEDDERAHHKAKLTVIHTPRNERQP